MSMAATKSSAPDGNYRIGESTIRNVRVADVDWAASGERAAADETNLSALIRDWLHNYAETGTPAASGRRPQIRLSAADRKAALVELEAGFAAAIDAINAERS